MRDKAKEYLAGTDTPPVPLGHHALTHVAHNHPRYLTQQVVHDFNSGQLGGSIASAVSVVGSQVAHLTGADQFFDFVGKVPKPGPRSLESEVAAYLVDQTYKNVDERPAEALMYERLPSFDTKHISVWRNKQTDELMVAVRGTKMQGSDLLQDAEVMFGKHVDDIEFTNLLDKLQTAYPDTKYDVAAHSLGCVYLMQEAENYGDKWDDTYLFNAPSSPAQNDNTLHDQLNNYGLDLYVNHGDPLGANTNHLLTPETLENHVVVGDYQYSPFGSHSLTQWYPSNMGAPPTNLVDAEKPTGGSQFQIDNEETQEAGLS